MITTKLLSKSTKLIKHIKCLSVSAYRQQLTNPIETSQYDNSKEIKSTKKLKTKKVQREPFLKNLFLGNCDVEILAYPEILDNEELSQLDNRLSQISNYFSTLDSTQIDKENSISKTIWQDLQSLGLFEQVYDGDWNLNATERSKIQEIIAKNPSVSTLLAAQQNLGLQGILLYGNEDQKNKYLQKIVEGNCKIGFCLLESASSSPVALNTKAFLNESNVWVLNGEKHWIVNGKEADVFIVFAETEQRNYMNKNESVVTAFLIDANASGLTITDSNPVGATAANFCNIQFTNVQIPKDNVLGEMDKGIEIAVSLLKSNRFHVGAECTGILRDYFKDVISHSIQLGNTELEWTKHIIAKAAVKLYAIESMTYLTAGLIDGYENQDTDLETTILKVFSSENCISIIEDCSELYGPIVYNKDHIKNKLLNYCRRHLYFDESNFLLKHYIALIGLQHAGHELADSIQKIRNPLFHPGFLVKKMWQERGQAKDAPNLYLQLDYNFHPSLRLHVQMAEYSIHRLRYATETLLASHGTEVVNQHINLERLANVAMDVYAMICVLSRASRSYCIGLQNADYEVMMANAYCFDAMARVKETVNNISSGALCTNDRNFVKIAEKMFQSKDYFAVHPTTRNF